MTRAVTTAATMGEACDSVGWIQPIRTIAWPWLLLLVVQLICMCVHLSNTTPQSIDSLNLKIEQAPMSNPVEAAASPIKAAAASGAAAAPHPRPRPRPRPRRPPQPALQTAIKPLQTVLAMLVLLLLLHPSTVIAFVVCPTPPPRHVTTTRAWLAPLPVPEKEGKTGDRVWFEF